MSEQIHIFRCPGPCEKNGVRYSVLGHTKGEELPEGWSETLDEAVVKPGKVALAPVKVNDARKVKMQGLIPSESPKVEKAEDPIGSNETKEEPSVEEVKESLPKDENEASEKQERQVVDDGENFRRYEELTDQEISEIKQLLTVEGVDEKGIRKQYNIHHFTLKKLKTED
jgi:hypothetical protein